MVSFYTTLMGCFFPSESLEICLRTGNNPTPFLEPLYMEDRMLSFSQLVKNTSQDDLPELLHCVKTDLRPLHENQYFVLGEQIKKQIHQLISMGQTTQAQQVLEQLWRLTSEDHELDIIAQRIG